MNPTGSRSTCTMHTSIELVITYTAKEKCIEVTFTSKRVTGFEVGESGSLDSSSTLSIVSTILDAD